MSDKVIVTKSKLTRIADKIRSKLSSTDTYLIDDMPDAIESISGGGGGIPVEGLIHKFDFTKETDYLIDEVQGYTIIESNNSAPWQTEGKGIRPGRGYGTFHTGIVLLPTRYDYTIKYKFGKMWDSDTATPTRNQSYIFTTAFNTVGLSWNGSSNRWEIRWKTYSGSIQTLALTDLTNITDLDNEEIIVNIRNDDMNHSGGSTKNVRTINATFTIKGVDYTVNSDFPYVVNLFGFDNKSMEYAWCEKVEIYRSIPE